MNLGPAQTWRCRRGFTLIELMVVIMLLTVVVSIGAPGLRDFVSGQRVKALAYDLSSDLVLARSEALKRNASVTITPRTEGWHAGWNVTSAGVDLASRESASETVVFDGAPGAISFNLHGRVSAPADAVRITVRSLQLQRCVELDLSGRAHVKVGACT